MTVNRQQNGVAPGDLDGSTSGPNLLQMLRRRHWLVWLAALVGLGLAYLYNSRQPPVFASGASVLLIYRAPDLPGQNGPTQQANLINDHLVLLRSPEFLKSAVGKGDFGSFPRLRDPAAAVAVMADGLKVSNPKGTNVINLAYTGPDPRECEAAVKAVLAGYKDYLNVSQQDASLETVTLITDAKDELLRDLSSAEAAYRTFRDKAPLTWIGSEGVNMHAGRLAKIEEARAELDLRLTDLQAELEAIRAAMAQGGRREALVLAAERAAKRQADAIDQKLPVSEADKLFPMMLELELLAETLGPDHPKVRSLRRQIDLTRSHINSLQGTNAGEKPADFVAVYVQSLEQQIDAERHRQTKLDELFKGEQSAAKALRNFEVEDEQHKKELSRLSELFDATVARLKELSLIQGFEKVRMHVLSPPGLGGLDRMILFKHLGLGAALGIFLGFGFAYLAEISDRSFRSPQDIRDQLGVPVIGHVPLLPMDDLRKRASALPFDPSLVTAVHPKSQLAEAYREVRASLFFGSRDGRHKIFQVSSPDVGDGKSTLSANLAVTVAQSGRRVLLVDGDVRRPRQGKIFGIKETGPGLGAAIRGEIDPVDAAVPSGVDGLWLLPCAKADTGKEELLAGSRFDDLLQVVKEQYDYVIVDSPPLLIVSDSATIAPRVDGVLLTIRLDKNSRAKALQTLEVLERVGASPMGIVVNRVTSGDYGGSYDTYTRRYYSYRYGSRYGNAYHEYADPPAEPAPSAGRAVASVNGNGRH